MNEQDTVFQTIVLVTDGAADGLFDQVRSRYRSAAEEDSGEAVRHVAFFRYTGINSALSYSDARSIRFESESQEAGLELFAKLIDSAGTSAKISFLTVNRRLDPGAVNIALSQGSKPRTLHGYVASDGASLDRYLEVLAHAFYQDDLRRCIDERVSTGYYKGMAADMDQALGPYASKEKVDEFKSGLERIVRKIQWELNGWNDIESPLSIAFGANIMGNHNDQWSFSFSKQPAANETFYLSTSWEAAAALLNTMHDRKIPILCNPDGDLHVSGSELHAAGLIDDAGTVTCAITDAERGSNHDYMIGVLNGYVTCLAEVFITGHDPKQRRNIASRRRKAIDWLGANGIEQRSPRIVSLRGANDPHNSAAAEIEALAMVAGFIVDVQDITEPTPAVVDGMDVEIYHDKDAFDRAVAAAEIDKRRNQSRPVGSRLPSR